MEALAEATRTSFLPWREIFNVHRLDTPLLPKITQNLFDRDDQANSASDGHITPAIIAAWSVHSQVRTADPREISAFVATAGFLTKSGTTPVVIIAPLHPSARDQTQFVRQNLLPALPPDTPVCDFSDYLDADRFFEDPAHLNAPGRAAIAPLFKELIMEMLAARGAPARTGELAVEVAQRCLRNSGEPLIHG
jgi:enamine deaminase RidA (YjgF/YER057c/UK114 family)